MIKESLEFDRELDRNIYQENREFSNDIFQRYPS
jgi:hypothetical protein